MARKASKHHTSSERPAESPVETGSGVILGELVAIEAADSAQFVGAVVQTVTLGQLVRPVARLPLHQFMSLNNAFVRAKNCLGGGGIAAHDLTQRARNRQLTVAARQILPDGTERVFIFRPKFWQYFAILRPDPIRPEIARVRGPVLLPGEWYCFVGCRRFERLYSTAAPSKPATQTPAPSAVERPDARNRGGRPDKYPHMRIALKALYLVALDGAPATLDGEGGLFEKLELTLKRGECPKPGTLYKIFSEVWKDIEGERKKRAEDERKKSRKKPGKLSPPSSLTG